MCWGTLLLAFGTGLCTWAMAAEFSLKGVERGGNSLISWQKTGLIQVSELCRATVLLPVKEAMDFHIESMNCHDPGKAALCPQRAKLDLILHLSVNSMIMFDVPAGCTTGGKECDTNPEAL